MNFQNFSKSSNINLVVIFVDLVAIEGNLKNSHFHKNVGKSEDIL